MPRYFFHLHDDIDAPDTQGMELADLDAARAFAVIQARHLVGETVKETGRVVLHHRIDIEDDAAAVLASVFFRDAVEVEP